MKIGINLTNFIPGKMGGAETYIRNLIAALQEIDKTNNYTIICDKDFEKEFLLNGDLFNYSPQNYTARSLKGHWRGFLRRRVEIELLRPEIERMDLDLIHHPFSDILPQGLKTPAVLTFHDMQQEFYPQFFAPDELEARRKSFRPSVLQALRVIAISGHVKQCLIQQYAVDPGKIDVVHLGCGPEFREIADQEVLTTVAEKYGLDAPFMYYPAATWPHKNHAVLLQSLRIMRDSSGFDGQLVLTGISKQAHDDIRRQIGQLGLAGSVKLLGYLPYADMPILYNLARIMVFPSLYEGFGLPLVEAMACGCPVVCSNVTSLPEIAGDAGVLFDPNSAEDMAAKIAGVWDDATLRREMQSRGLERAKLFTWEHTARKTLASYQRACRALHGEQANFRCGESGHDCVDNG